METYQALIDKTLSATSYADVPPRLVEAWMRSERGTLDALSPLQFAIDAMGAAAVAQVADPQLSEALAQSYGL